MAKRHSARAVARHRTKITYRWFTVFGWVIIIGSLLAATAL